MNKAIKKQWVDALRSGDYSQGKHCLQDENNNFCCLGVLTDLYIKSHRHSLIEWSKDISYENDIPNYPALLPVDGKSPTSEPRQFEAERLPDIVAEWSGFNPAFEYNNMDLEDINDDGVTFDEIANIIEEQEREE